MSDLVVSIPEDPRLAEALGQIPDTRIVTWDLDGPAPLAQIDIVVPPYWGSVKRLVELASTDVRLVQSQSIGYNGVDEYLPEGVPFANAATVHETSTAELTLALILASQRGIPDFVRAGDRHQWQPSTYQSLADRRVLIVGYGGVGKAIEARLGGFEVEVSRIARTARTDRDASGRPVPVRGMDELHGLLGVSDVVILAVPLTADTHGLIDADALAAMRDGALLVNVARGPVVVTDALVDALRAGRIRAAVDVTDPEPLPEDHPLWDCPGLLVSPHVGGDSSAMMPRIAALIKRQLTHLREGTRPENLVFGEWA